MRIAEITEQEKNEYNQFVKSCETGSFLQSFEWGAWQESLGRKVFRFWLKDGEQVIGTIQLATMPLVFGGYYLYAPYGPVLKENQAVSSLYQGLKKQIIEKFPEAVFIRLEPKDNSIIKSLNHLIIKSTNIQPGKTLLLELGKSEDQLLAQMHPKTRYNIKVAQRHNVEIQDEFGITVEHGLYFDEAIILLVETGKRQGFSNYPKQYFEKMADFFALHNLGELKLHIYKSVFQQRLLSSAVFIDFGDTRTFLFGGSSPIEKNVMAPYLLHWRAILDAKAAGLKFYDFWGTETSRGDVPGFVRFKLGFGGSEKTYTGAYDFISRRFAYGIYKYSRILYRLLKR
jgi:lipid II:glycine glycyltransferase (peptidoglycan interpeptide bridge formation enzyme)